MRRILSCALLIIGLFAAPAFCQDHSAEVKFFKTQLENKGVNLSGACGAFAITQRVAWDLRFQGYKFLVKQGGNRAILQSDGSCLDGDHASGPGYATDYLISVNEGYVGYDLLGDGGGANNPQWIGPETDAEMVDRNRKNFGEPVQPAGGAPADPMDPSFVRRELSKLYASWCVTPGPSGPTDIEYYIGKIIETGGWSSNTARGENNIGYWTGRIKSDGGFSNCGGVPTPSPVVDLDPILAALAQANSRVAALEAKIEELKGNINSVNDRVNIEEHDRLDQIGQVNLRFDGIKLPTGCRVQYFACRLNF